MKSRSRSWLLLCALHAVASMLLWWSGEAMSASWIWRSDVHVQQPWTWWSSAWVHLNTSHLISNQIALGLLAGLAWVVRPSVRCTWFWLLSWPLTQLTLSLWPQIGHAVGLTGLLHAGAAVLGMELFMRRIRIPKARRWGLLIILALVSKMLFEQAWSYPVVWDASSDAAVVQAMHLSGTLWGLGLSLTLGSGYWRRLYAKWSPRQRSTASVMSDKVGIGRYKAGS